MRIVFLGTPPTAVPSLRALIEHGHLPALVVTRPDRPAGRGRELAPSAVAQAARAVGLDLVQPERVRDRAFLERLEACEADCLIVVAFGRILPESVLRVARRGAINVHFSLLPRYRGAAPVQWALARGETSTGVTTMFMNEKMDEGDVLLRQEVSIEPREHAPSLAARLSHGGASLLLETLRRLELGDLPRTHQDHLAATYAPPLRREDGEIAPDLPAREIEGRVRGFDPWPGVWLASSGRRLRLVEVRALEERAADAAPGTLMDDAGGVAMACGAGTTLLLEAVQLEGRRVLAARDAVNGRQLVPGERLAPLTGRSS